MKKYILSLAVLSAATLFTACNDNLDTDPRVYELNAETFPGKPADVEALCAGTYSILSTLGGGDQSQILNNPFYWWSLMSDDNYGSGGLQDFIAKSLHHFTMADANQYEYDWNLLYGGVARANTMIETINNVKWTDEEMAQRDQLLGEAFFMRGLYTMWLSQMYGDIPLITSTLITSDSYIQRDAGTIVYPQIIADFVSAATLMKPERANGSGHADKYCAEAFLARAYMFWAGFYMNTKELANGGPTIELKTINGDVINQMGLNVSSVSKDDVITGLRDVINNGGYKLCEDYRSLWNYSNSYLWKEAQEEGGYWFIKDMDEKNCFDQPGMGNGNTEELFQIQFMNASSWSIGGYYSNPRMYSNYLSCFWGLRNGASQQNGQRDKTYPWNQGWGQGTPSCNIWDDWTIAENKGGYTDIRKYASMISLNEERECKEYTYEKDDCEESGYSVKKYASVNVWANANNNETWWSQFEGFSGSLGNAQQGDHFEDFYLMRYSDVLLMMTELTGQPEYMNQVQARAGVPQTPYTLENVQNERRWEFAFEGLRFNDMRRWTGKGCSNSEYAPKALQAQEGKQIVCLGQKGSKIPMHHMTCSWTERYKATDGFLPKPQNQITLHNGGLEQNPGWDTSDPNTQYKALY
jgi:hypothetical protein